MSERKNQQIAPFVLIGDTYIDANQVVSISSLLGLEESSVHIQMSSGNTVIASGKTEDVVKRISEARDATARKRARQFAFQQLDPNG